MSCNDLRILVVRYPPGLVQPVPLTPTPLISSQTSTACLVACDTQVMNCQNACVVVGPIGPMYMQTAGGEIDIIPAQIHQLAGSKLVAVGRPASMLNVCLANCDHDHVLPLRRMACDPAMGETLGVPIVGVGEL
jgi:hypothetical protein